MEATKSSYTGSHKKYYESNKEAILARYKENKPYKAFYERNKDKLKAKALERYYAKKLQAEETPGSPNITPAAENPGEAV
jgi:hypothetical protein